MGLAKGDTALGNKPSFFLISDHAVQIFWLIGGGDVDMADYMYLLLCGGNVTYPMGGQSHFKSDRKQSRMITGKKGTSPASPTLAFMKSWKSPAETRLF